MKMATPAKKISNGTEGKVDRISDLPEFILHHILSFLDTREACRVSILSKKWAHVWRTTPFLNFQIEHFIKEEADPEDLYIPSKYDEEYYDKEFVYKLVSYVDCAIQRYCEGNLRIKKFSLEFPILDPNMAVIVDTWIHKLVLSNIEELRLAFFVNNYALPEVLFTARSLKHLQCSNVKLPHYGVMNLISLANLSLKNFVSDEIMLQHIISVCPLMYLEIVSCAGVANLSIPSSSRIKSLRCYQSGVINLEIVGHLQGLIYYGDEESWPYKMSGAALSSLKNLELFCTSITDVIFQSVISELHFLEKLEFHCCDLPLNIHISSDSLKTLTLDDCGFLESAVINAPNLGSFCYTGDNDTALSFTSIHPDCAGYFDIYMDSVNSLWFVKLKKFFKKFFMKKTDFCKRYNILLRNNVSMRDFKAPELRNPQPSITVRELKISPAVQWTPGVSALSSFLDGLFWGFHPEILSISASLDSENGFIKLLVEALKKKVKCWQEPLKDFEVVSVKCPGLMSKYEMDDSDNLDIQFRLHWQ